MLHFGQKIRTWSFRRFRCYVWAVFRCELPTCNSPICSRIGEVPWSLSIRAPFPPPPSFSCCSSTCTKSAFHFKAPARCWCCSRWWCCRSRCSCCRPIECAKTMIRATVRAAFKSHRHQLNSAIRRIAKLDPSRTIACRTSSSSRELVSVSFIIRTCHQCSRRSHFKSSFRLDRRRSIENRSLWTRFKCRVSTMITIWWPPFCRTVRHLSRPRWAINWTLHYCCPCNTTRSRSYRKKSCWPDSNWSKAIWLPMLFNRPARTSRPRWASRPARPICRCRSRLDRSPFFCISGGLVGWSLTWSCTSDRWVCGSGVWRKTPIRPASTWKSTVCCKCSVWWLHRWPAIWWIVKWWAPNASRTRSCDVCEWLEVAFGQFWPPL